MKKYDIKLGIHIALAFFTLAIALVAVVSFLVWDKNLLLNWVTFRIAAVWGIAWGIYAYFDPELK